MQFGIFDQNDRGPYSLTEQYEKRLTLIEFYDRAGFRTYHMSEHHSTPLNLTPSPSVFLAAVTQRTRRMVTRLYGLEGSFDPPVRPARRRGSLWRRRPPGAADATHARAP